MAGSAFREHSGHASNKGRPAVLLGTLYGVASEVRVARPRGAVGGPSRRFSARPAIALVVAVSVFVLAVRNGTYDDTSRQAFAIAVWWVVVLAATTRFVGTSGLSAAAWWAGAGLLGLATLAGLSALWGPSVENALGVLDLDCLYLGVFVLVAVAVRRAALRFWCDGLALGIAAIVGLALLSRLFPDLGPGSAQFRFLATMRLSYPMGYWNALAAFGALGAPLVLRSATASPRFAVRALSVGYLPVLAGVVYLTSSRGGAITTVIGLITFLVLTQRRVVSTLAVVAGGAGAAGVVAVLVARRELVTGPLGAVAAHEGHTAVALIVPICAATGLAYALVSGPLLRSSFAFAERAVLVGLALAVGAAVVAVHPISRVRAFKQLHAVSSTSQNPITEHLLSGSGSGRWQLWKAAADEFKAHPALGEGAGTFQSWWGQHRAFSSFVKNAHSLYLETLGELGAIGLALVALFVLAGVVAAVRRAYAARDEERVTRAALAAGFVAFAVAVAFDWLWQIPAVGAVGIALLALVTGPGLAVKQSRPPRRRYTPLIARSLVVAVGLAAVGVEVVPLLGDLQLHASQAAVRRGNGQEALRSAATARDIEPWASSPYLQLALVEEEAGMLAPARADIRRAIRRDHLNWQLWFVAARIESESGAARAARRSLAQAHRLNPLGVEESSGGG